MSQCSAQKPDSLRFGSVCLLLGDDVGSLVDLGCLRGASYVSKVENNEIEFDNCSSITQFAKGDRASFTLQLAEVDLTTLSKIDDGLFNLSVVAATPVAITDENIVALTGQAVIFANKNGDNTIVASVTVTNVGGSITYVEGTDYELIVNSQGYTALVMIDGGGITSGQTLEVDYTYTPNASKKLTLNTTGQKIGKYARIVNTDSQGREFRIDIDECTNITALELPFQSDNGEDVMVVAIELEGTVVEIVDEQSVI